VGEVLTLQIYLATNVKKAVIERDTDNLTAEELRKHHEEVAAAILQELLTWQSFSRKLRKFARNIIDTRWVVKWNWETDPSTNAKRRIIRARLCVRGFKDVDAVGLSSYAGTAKRYSQRLLVSEAVQQGWDICTTDINTALLQGVTYEELAEITGAPMREVNFYLPKGSVAILQRLDGSTDFNPGLEVLHCDKPGTGLVDAPSGIKHQIGTNQSRKV